MELINDIKQAYKLICLFEKERKIYSAMLDRQIKYLNELNLFMKSNEYKRQ